MVYNREHKRMDDFTTLCLTYATHINLSIGTKNSTEARVTNFLSTNVTCFAPLYNQLSVQLRPHVT